MSKNPTAKESHCGHWTDPFHHCFFPTLTVHCLALSGGINIPGMIMPMLLNQCFQNQSCRVTFVQIEIACRKETVRNPDATAVLLDFHMYLEKQNFRYLLFVYRTKGSKGTLNTIQSNTASAKQKALEHKRAQLNRRLKCHKNKLHQITSFIRENIERLQYTT